MGDRVETFTLKAGTVVKIGGIPACLSSDTAIETSPDNWRLIEESQQGIINTGFSSAGIAPRVSTDDGFIGDGIVR